MTETKTEQSDKVRLCSLCDVPIATDGCPHVEIDADRVTMSRAAWDRLVDELIDARNRMAHLPHLLEE